MKLIPLLIPIPFLFIALYTDVKNRKIYNKTTYPLIILSLVYRIYTDKLSGLLVSLLTILLLFILLSIMPGLNFGGGDIKLMMGISNFIGIKNGLLVLLIAMIINFIYNIIFVIKKQDAHILLNTIKIEIITGFNYQTDINKTTGAIPIILSYFSMLIINIL